jgi:hypothetical protein
MVMIVYMIEDGIYQSVEESRKWGGYSVSLAEMPTQRLRSLLSPSSQRVLLEAVAPSRNADRYYGMNTNMNRHGTVEFRYFPGGPTKEELCSWIDLVVSIKKAARKYNKEALISMLTSPDAVVSFLMNEFGDWGNRLLGAMGPERLFNSFAEVATMAGDDDPRELASSVMWVSKHYLDFLGNTMFKGSKESVGYLQNIIKHSNVLSKADWNYYLSQARNLDRTPHQQQDYDEPDEYEEEQMQDLDPPSDAGVDVFQRHQQRIQEMLDRERERSVARQQRVTLSSTDPLAARPTLTENPYTTRAQAAQFFASVPPDESWSISYDEVVDPLTQETVRIPVPAPVTPRR